MAKKISELPAASSLTGSELVEVVQGGVSKKTPVSSLGGGGGSSTWGSIGGTLADQTDLVAALDGKVDKVAGKGLSQEDFTTALRTKLVNIQDDHFRGTFTSFAAMVSGVTSPVAGDYADVDAGAGTDVVRYVWDVSDAEWQAGTGGGGPASTDALPEGLSNLYFTEGRVRGSLLTGLSVAVSAAITATDSVLSAMGKLQAQISALVTGKQDTLVSGTNIKSINGTSLLGAGNLTISGGSSATYATASISSGALTLDLATAQTFGVMLNANVTTLTLSGATAGQRSSIDAIFSQAAAGGFSVSKPATLSLPEGVAAIASAAARDITYVRFTSVDGGTTWFLDKRVIFNVPPAVSLPPIADENSTFNDEGAATTGWTPTNASLTQSGSWLRQTKTTGGSSSSMTKTIGTFTPTNSDFILYGKVRSNYASGNTGVIWLLNGSKEISIWFGSAAANSSTSLGAVSICGTTGTSTRNVLQVASGLNYETSAVDFALQYDHKFSSLTCWFRETDGRWKFKGRVACNWFSAADIQVLTSGGSAAGAWIEFDHLTLAKPNLALLSDSTDEGKTLYSPNISLGLNNDESTWMRHARIYQSLRNNLVVNKGVGGNTSAMMLSRITDVTGLGARVLFMTVSSNDEGAGVSQATRKSTIQSIVDAAVAASMQVVMLNGSYGTATGSDNTPTPDLRDYMKLSWETQLNTLTNVYETVDTMQALRDGSDFLDASLAADGIHYNVAGHTAKGLMIAS